MGWWKGFTFLELKEIYTKEIKQLQHELDYGYEGKWTYIRYCYFSVIYTQLMNGCRISEAVEAVTKYYNDGIRKQKVMVRKQRKNKKYIDILIPKIVYRHYLGHIENIKDNPHRISYWMYHYWVNKYGVENNTHTNRHCAITHMIDKMNVNPLTIKEITGHSNIDIITSYYHTEQALATKKKLLGDEDE